MTIHEFNLPVNFNGEQFTNESQAKDVYVRENTLFVESEKTRAELELLLKNHKPKPVTEPTVAQKLTSVGLSIDDLKVALGL
jgi:hypothetical protein